jgi:hypothetical protein
MKVVNDALVLSSTDMSQASITSAAQPADSLVNILIQCVAAGAPVGSLKIQASCDPQNATPVNWSDVGSAVAVSAAGTFSVPFVDNAACWLRLVYTKTSGTGTLSARLNAKGI